MDPVFAFFLLLALVVVMAAVLVKTNTFPLLVEINKNVTVDLPIEAEEAVRKVAEAYTALDKVKAGITFDEQTVEQAKSLVAASLQVRIGLLSRENDRLQDSIIQNKKRGTYHSVDLAEDQEIRIGTNTAQIQKLLVELEGLCHRPIPA